MRPKAKVMLPKKGRPAAVATGTGVESNVRAVPVAGNLPTARVAASGTRPGIQLNPRANGTAAAPSTAPTPRANATAAASSTAPAASPPSPLGPPPAHHPSPVPRIILVPTANAAPRVRYSSVLGDRSPSPISPTYPIRRLPFNSTLLTDSLFGNSFPETPDGPRYSIPKSAFRNLVKSIGEDYGDFRWGGLALDILQEVSEGYLAKMFFAADIVSRAGRRKTVSQLDLHTAKHFEDHYNSKSLDLF